MKKTIYNGIQHYLKNTEYRRLGASKKKNSRPKKYGRKLSTGFKK